MSKEELKGEPRILSIDSEIPSSPPSKGSSFLPPKKEPTESDYFSGICPGILYSAGDGGIQRYVPRSCHTGGPCRVSCRLYGPNGECKYEESLKGTLPPKHGETYRLIDNLIGVPNQSSLNIPERTQTEKSVLVVKDALETVGTAKTECIPSEVPTLPNIQDLVDAELKRLAGGGT